MDKSKIDLSKPAFGEGSQRIEDLKVIEPETKETSVEETKQDVKVTEEEMETSVEETKVPYSRFKNVHQRALDSEREAEKWRARAEELEQSRFTKQEAEEDPNTMPREWAELYGDSEASVKAWKIQKAREDAIERRAYEAGQRGALELKNVERERVNSNLSVIDENFEDLSAQLGRDLSEKEQAAILDIVDSYTAQDDDGNYLGALMPFDRAYEIYELKQNSGKVAQRKSRDTVASLSGASTQGDTEVKGEKDKDFNPLDWKAWKRRIN